MFQMSIPKTVSAFALATLLLSIVGCASRGIVPTTLSQKPNAMHTISPSLGGTFSAKYSGRDAKKKLQRGLCFGWTLDGRGRAAFLGQSQLKVIYCENQGYGASISMKVYPISSPANRIELGAGKGTSSPCEYKRYRSPLDWSVDFGKGRFHRARGSGIAFFSCGSHTFSVVLNGTLHY